MEVFVSGADDFKKLAAKFKAAGKNGAAIRKKLTATIQKRLSRITDEQKSRALNMKIEGIKDTNARTHSRAKPHGAKGAGTTRRESFHLSASLRGKKVRRRKGGYGLRVSVARGIKSKVSYTGRKLGARVLVDTSALPPSQRQLPKNLDKPRGWRHPLFGNRDWWYGERSTDQYFSGPIIKWRNAVRREIKNDIDEVLRTLK